MYPEIDQGSRQAQIKEEEDGAPIVTHPPLHGYTVAPPGPMTCIHIQKVQQQFAALGTDPEAAKPKCCPRFCGLGFPAPQHWASGFGSGFCRLTDELWPVGVCSCISSNVLLNMRFYGKETDCVIRCDHTRFLCFIFGLRNYKKGSI